MEALCVCVGIHALVKSRRVCLQTPVFFGSGGNVWGSSVNATTLCPTSSHLTLLLRGNEGSSSLEPGGRSNSTIKKAQHKAPCVYVCVCVCDSLESEAGNKPATPSKPIPLQLSDL